MNLSHEQSIFAEHVSQLIKEIFAKGYSCSLGEAYRTPEQAEIYAKTGKGIKDSLHCKKLAIDLNLYDPSGKYLDKSEDHKIFGLFWEKLDSKNKWGGTFTRPDGNHYQRTI